MAGIRIQYFSLGNKEQRRQDRFQRGLLYASAVSAGVTLLSYAGAGISYDLAIDMGTQYLDAANSLVHLGKISGFLSGSILFFWMSGPHRISKALDNLENRIE